jgi:2-hydroxy-3-oxopropionate reductase
MAQRVGYIGLGIMGRPMALRLREAGYPVHVWARRAGTLAPLLEAGAVAEASPRELAAAVDVVFLNVSDTPDVESLAEALMEGLRPSGVVVDHSTIEPAAARRIAARLTERGAFFLDAPVSGGEAGAKAGTLSIMVGGEAAALERVRPLLEVVGGHIVHVGPSGAGQLAKVCNQIVVAETLTAVAEAFALCEAAGVEPARVREALLGGFAYSRILEVHGERMLRRDYRPGFKAGLHRKDLGIALRTAQEEGVALPGAALAAQLMNTLAAGSGAGLDSSALAEVVRRLNGLESGLESIVGDAVQGGAGQGKPGSPRKPRPT